MKVAYTIDEDGKWYICHEVGVKGLIEFGVDILREKVGKDKTITVNIIELQTNELREATDYASDKQSFIRSSRKNRQL